MIPYLYTRINTLSHKPLHLQEHLCELSAGAEALYGSTPELDAKQVERDIIDLLRRERMPLGGNIVELRATPRTDGRWVTSLLDPQTTLYDGYSLHSLRPEAVIINHELPFERWRTECSALCADFAADYARRRGADVALRANRAGNLVSSADNPLFLVRNRMLHTLPLSKGGRGSVERELMFKLAQMAGMQIVECDTPVDELDLWEELIIFGPTGIQAIGSCSGRIMGYSTALALEKYLPRL